MQTLFFFVCTDMLLVWRLALCTAVVTPVAGIIELPLNHFSVDDARSDGVYIEVGIGTPSERSIAILLTRGRYFVSNPPRVPPARRMPLFSRAPVGHTSAWGYLGCYLLRERLLISEAFH